MLVPNVVLAAADATRYPSHVPVFCKQISKHVRYYTETGFFGTYMYTMLVKAKANEGVEARRCQLDHDDEEGLQVLRPTLHTGKPRASQHCAAVQRRKQLVFRVS